MLHLPLVVASYATGLVVPSVGETPVDWFSIQKPSPLSRKRSRPQRTVADAHTTVPQPAEKRSYCVAIPNSISSSLGRRDASRASTICDAIRLEHDRSRSTSIDRSTLRTCMAASSPSSSSRMYSVASYAKGCEGCLHDASESGCCLGKIDLVTCDHSPA